jgi:hypothetical protein
MLSWSLRREGAPYAVRLRIVRVFLVFALRHIADFCGIEQGNIRRF